MKVEINKKRDDAIITDYFLKDEKGEYVLSVTDLENLYDVTSPIIYKIIRRNGLLTREKKKKLSSEEARKRYDKAFIDLQDALQRERKK